METDAQLIDRAVAGNSNAFGEVLRRHQLPVYSYLARRTGAQAAEDLLAEVWMAAYEARASFDAHWESARPWLFGIARNVLRQHWRHQRPAHYELGQISDPWPQVDERLTAVKLTDELRSSLLALSPMQREVLLLVVWEELEPTEVAGVLGILPSTARSHLRRARQALLELAPTSSAGPNTGSGGKG
jgi:RNA polymerase sigma factor (sigma-70 family)